MTGLRRCGALLTLSLTLYGVVCRAQPKAIEDLATHGAWGEQADGTYANPVLPADFSDLDVTLVGDTFYA